MSRVEDALRRAMPAPRLAAANGQIAERAAERLNHSVLEQFPEEDRRFAGSSTGAEQQGDRVVVSTGQGPDVVVSPRFSKAYQHKLVSDAAVSPASIEQYRRLAGTVHHLHAQHGLRRLVVSSAVPREGKTLTVVNLAMTLSESYGRRVLLIDADLRRPSVHDVFGISNRNGLCDALRSDRPQFQFSRVSSNLWVLPAGSPDADPMTALASRHLEQFLDDVSSHFDWVLLDTPPFGLIADAALLARLTRAVIVVIAAGSTPYKVIEKFVAELGREHIVGAVLNRAEQIAQHWSDYYSGEGPGLELPKSESANRSSFGS